MTRFFWDWSWAVVGGPGGGAETATGAGSGGGGGGAGAAAGAAAAAGAGALAGSSMTPMMFSETPAFFSFTKSAVVRLAGLFSLCKVLMIRFSDSPIFTDWITESTGEVVAAGFAAAGFAGAGLGAGGVCARHIMAKRLSDARDTSFIK